MRFLLFALLFFILFSSLRAENKFSFTGTPGKLPKEVQPTRYALRIEPDLEKLTFTGSAIIWIEVKKPVTKLVLNALELEIASVTVDGRPLPKKSIRMEAKEQTLTLDLPNELKAGSWQLAIRFSGRINPQGQGLFYASYQEKGTNKKKMMLGTQFEATDARRMFPCWDEPTFRASFQLTAVLPKNFVAVSNMPIEQERPVVAGGGDPGTAETKEVRFAKTPSMSSYLLVLCAGELDAIEAKEHGVQLRVFATKGKAEMGRYALESAAKILDYYNDYFGVPYPLPKLDLIAVPGGFGGAMENWGGITFYESALLFNPEVSSIETKQDIFAVVAHEMAHQWFGNLVTMAWWDNLWLNEGFASWMGTKCTDHFNPEWNEWFRRNVQRDPSRRIGFSKDIAMQSDARSTTHPVQHPVATEAEAGNAFDEITYRKGGAIIRMIESFLGEDVFRDGIRKYITAHSYSNTTTTDLWQALGDASGKPIGEIARGWTEQPGFPLVQVERAGSRIKLSQERFTVHFANPPPGAWQVPLTYATEAQGGSKSFLLRETRAELPDELASDRAIKFNVSNAGYYRVQYDETSWKLLLGQVEKFSQADRVDLLTDAWAFVEANRRPLSHYLELVNLMLKDDQLAVYDQVIDTFAFINRLLAEDAARPHFQLKARTLLRPAFDRVGWEPKTGEPLERALLRTSLIRGLGVLDDSDIVAGCRARFERYLKNRASVSPDLRPVIFRVVGRYADAKTWEKLHQLGLKTTSVEEKQYLYGALASAVDPSLLPQTMAIALTDELTASRAAFLLPFAARYGEHPELVWEFAQAHMKALLAKQDALGIDSFAPGLFTFYAEPEKAELLEKYAKENLPPAASRAVAKAVEEIGFRAEFKARLIPQLKSWAGEESR